MLLNDKKILLQNKENIGFVEIKDINQNNKILILNKKNYKDNNVNFLDYNIAKIDKISNIEIIDFIFNYNFEINAKITNEYVISTNDFFHFFEFYIQKKQKYKKEYNIEIFNKLFLCFVEKKNYIKTDNKIICIYFLNNLNYLLKLINNKNVTQENISYIDNNKNIKEFIYQCLLLNFHHNNVYFIKIKKLIKLLSFKDILDIISYKYNDENHKKEIKETLFDFVNEIKTKNKSKIIDNSFIIHLKQQNLMLHAIYIEAEEQKYKVINFLQKYNISIIHYSMFDKYSNIIYKKQKFFTNKEIEKILIFVNQHLIINRKKYYFEEEQENEKIKNYIDKILLEKNITANKSIIDKINKI